MSAAPEPKKFRDSAAVVLVRGEGASCEAYWVQRSDAVPFQPGFHAFVGGKVDAGDAHVPLAGVADDFERAARVCAFREVLEETGVLPGVRADAAALADARTALLDRRASFAELLERHGWALDPAALTPAGRWQTPVFAPVRFDTLFFLARVPDGQQPRVIPGELAEGEWVKPADALERYRRGEVTFAAPILWTLLALGEDAPDLPARLASAPERAATPARRIELEWGVVLHAMPTKPLPPARHTNAYFVGEHEMVLVDPGSGDDAALAELFAVADLLTAQGRRVTGIVVTHHHPDHTGGVAAARARFGVPVIGHTRLAERLAVDRVVGDGDTIALASPDRDWTLRVLHVPGHTRDSIALWVPRTRALLVGDLVPGGPGSVIVDPPDGDMGEYLASLERLAALEPRTLFPAHGSPQGAAVRRICALIAHRREREAKVLGALGDAPAELAALLERAYADTPRELWPLAERSLVAHLELLERGGRAVRHGERWSRARA